MANPTVPRAYGANPPHSFAITTKPTQPRNLAKNCVNVINVAFLAIMLRKEISRRFIKGCYACSNHFQRGTFFSPSLLNSQSKINTILLHHRTCAIYTDISDHLFRRIFFPTDFAFWHYNLLQTTVFSPYRVNGRGGFRRPLKEKIRSTDLNFSVC